MEVKRSVDLTPDQLKTITDLIGQYLPDTTVWAFGSRAKWTSNSKSDLDLVAFANKAHHHQVELLREEFEESDLPFRVDLLIWDELSRDFQKEIGKFYFVFTKASSRTQKSKQSNEVIEWEVHRLGDCIEINDSSYSLSEAWPVVNYLETKEVTDNRISSFKQIVKGKDKLPSRARRKVLAGDIVYSTVRPNHRHFGILKSIPDNLLVSTGFVVLRGKEGIADTRFIYWFLIQKRIIEYLQLVAEQSTSTYPSIKPSDIEQLTVRLPPVRVQREISRTLNALDDKIELNRKMNETLEEMGRALFKSWFVDFDPVRAKMEGRDTGLPKHIADLFPDRLIDSELGKVPVKWESFCLDELVEHHTRTIKPSMAKNSKFEHYSIPAYDESKSPRVEEGESIRSNKTDIPAKAVLLSKINPAITRVWMPFDYETYPQICSTEFMVFTPRRIASRSLLYSLFLEEGFRAILKSMVTGTSTSHQRVPAIALKQVKVITGVQSLFEIFDGTVSPMLEQSLKLRLQTAKLIEIRDAILPALISGDLQFCDAEFCEEYS